MRRRDFLILGTALLAFGGTAMADNPRFSSEHITTNPTRLLAVEFANWHRNLAEKGVIPRAFSGISATGMQVVLVLTGLPLDRIQRRQFLIWLCREEEFLTYAYSTEVGISNHDGTIIDALDIYASSARLDISKTLLIHRSSDGRISLEDDQEITLDPNSQNGPFFGLQQSAEVIPSQNEQLFVNLWRKLKQNAMWRQR